MPEQLIKICGLSTPETLDAAVDAGATHVGLVHYPPSPRHVSLDHAAALRRRVPPHVKVVLLPAAGMTAAAVVPNTIYSPLFRKLVEWVEYLCLMPIFPLALWLMNVYAAIRYR